ncbi:MAG: cysteine synthase A [Acidobacteriota bacterium]
MIPIDHLPADGMGLIGQTPLVYLPSVSARAGAHIYGKCEFLNPTGSVKDRPARTIVLEAEKRGELRPGGTLVEGTAGNTGIGLALVAAVRKYRCIFIIPDTMSPEKAAFARLLGAEVRLVPKVPYADPANYNHVARDLAREIPNAIWCNQFDNPDNILAHYTTTGPEIWQQTEGRVEAVVMGSGTGGTLTGVGRFLKERNKGIKIILADGPGSVLYSYIKEGQPRSEGSSIVEGVGVGRVTDCFDRSVVDDALMIPDQEAVNEAYRLLWDEGLLVGASAGLSVAGAVAWARNEGKGKVIVCNLCDSGSRYMSRLFSPEWLSGQGLTVPARAHAQGSAAQGTDS